MPEIGEVARVVHFLRKYLKSRRIVNVLTTDDQLVFNTKVGTTPSGFASAIKHKTIQDVRQQGKYFWFVLDSPPHPLMHLGMNGWVKINCTNKQHAADKDSVTTGEEDKEGEVEDEGQGRPVAGAGKGKWKGRGKEQGWPPKYWKFVLQMDDGVEAAFTDSRRLGRIRLVDCPAEDMRNTTPLKENGPDPVQDKHILTLEWLRDKMRKKKVPVKALLLDQASISGVGNWVADEVLYNARLHPEQYSNTFDDTQIKQLHTSLMYVCDIACQHLADPTKYPKDWLYKHRWGKGKKLEKNMVLPNGEKYVHITVAGRTSAIVPTLQQKTGPVTEGVDTIAADEVEIQESSTEPKLVRPKRKGRVKMMEESQQEESARTKPVATKRRTGKRKASKLDVAGDEQTETPVVRPGGKRKAKKLDGTKEEEINVKIIQSSSTRKTRKRTALNGDEDEDGNTSILKQPEKKRLKKKR